MHHLAFVVNPIAGMGGRVGLKGTDGVVEEAIKRGATPVSGSKAVRMLVALSSGYDKLAQNIKLKWYTCSHDMGEYSFKSARVPATDYEVIYRCPSEKTTAIDTKKACDLFLAYDVELIIFCGGDGTARDIYDVVGRKIPLLGIPAGVKMHSGIFGVNPESVAQVLIDFLNGELTVNDAEILDLDEAKYREGEWSIRLYGYATTPHEPTYIQTGKATFEEVPDEDIKMEIAEFIIEKMESSPNTVFILGPGSTVQTIGTTIGIDTTLLGLDAVKNKQLIAKDVNEQHLLELISTYDKVELVLSPIGAQGFILGRGNLQLSAEVIKKIGLENIHIISTPSKLARTPVLRVDTGDPELDAAFRNKGYIVVINGYHSMCMRPIRA
jgi:predicted polyphosphate/ATP-dependent NAD kinase